jgi:Uncharacterized protein conserved in bacteria
MNRHKVALHVTLAPDVKVLAQKAAALELISVSEYITRLIVASAPSIIDEASTITLNNDDFDRFVVRLRDE